MRIRAFHATTILCITIPLPALAQVDQQRAQEWFKEAQAICNRDGGRLWGVSICAPMVIGDGRTQTFATSQPPPDGPRPQLIGLVNGPVQWGDTMWAAMTWETMVNWPARTRGEAFIHESFHIVQMRLGLGMGRVRKRTSGSSRWPLWVAPRMARPRTGIAHLRRATHTRRP